MLGLINGRAIIGLLRRRVAVGLALLALSAARPAVAGPPFVSDDPEPTDTGHWEIYNYAAGTHGPGETAGEAGLDINYGGARDLQLTVTAPINFQSGTQVGLGDIELAAKYRFLHQASGSWLPDLAVFPRVFLPTASRQFGPQRLNLFLPVWGEKDFGKWSVFGGGGYDLNPGLDNRNFWLSGVVLTRNMTDRLTLGGEVYHQTPDNRDARTFTGLNLGGLYKLTDHWALLASGGPGVQNARQQGLYDFYVSLEATY